MILLLKIRLSSTLPTAKKRNRLMYIQGGSILMRFQRSFSFEVAMLTIPPMTKTNG